MKELRQQEDEIKKVTKDNYSIAMKAKTDILVIAALTLFCRLAIFHLIDGAIHGI